MTTKSLSAPASEEASAAGRALYQEVWQIVDREFFATTRLANWSEWEHKYDAEIVGEDSAIACARTMLASLKDPYTELVDPEGISSVEEALSDAPNHANAGEPNVTSFILPQNLGYLRILSFDDIDVTNALAIAVAKIAACRGILLDLRHNNGGRMDRAIDSCCFFLDNGLLTTVERRSLEGISRWQYFLNDKQFFGTETLLSGPLPTEFYDRREPVLAGKPLVILINRRTASAAEMFITALIQNGIAGQVCLVGGDTAGKGIGQVVFDLTGSKTTLRVTRSHWFTPGGDWLGDCGQTLRDPINPDIAVQSDKGPQGLKIGYDKLCAMLTEAAA